MEIKHLRSPQTEDILPDHWYNIVPDLPEPLPPMKKPNGEDVKPEELIAIFPKKLIEQEFSTERFIKIPDELLSLYLELGRPTPLFRARRLEEFLDTPARIYYKYEGVLPTGSHKINTAIAQAYFNMLEGTKRLTTETGAGQWGSALALAGALFGLKVRVYMVRASYDQKPYRRILMQIYGAEVIPSPSPYTKSGREILERDPNHPGSLGIAISEAIEDAVTNPGTKYSLGSVLNHVLLHQTIIGLEAIKQFELIGEELPDIVIGCVGGGSNFAGLAYPFYYEEIVRGKKKSVKIIAVEPKAVPSMTRGIYTYDYGDTARLTPMLKMYTVGHRYTPPPIHAGGLRYHGVAPTLALLVKNNIVKPVAYHQTEVFRAAQLFAQMEGIVPAPESAHAVKAVIDEAIRAREEREKKVIIFNLSGHGLLDLAGYQEYLENRLRDYEPEKIDLSYLNTY
ncbi:pyridoxal-phosphate dependent TrpB-like enzyme [Ignisphaera aggregans DSM 17230]|uniref:Tryptophan synthase beta chain n=1 Tax=Ignisphaera aggregans (strain DSM 17230 / JCM 13409 / AQ1.S1) TaxID=583356 RepID=E0SS52_IGNAA|nr:pyridoxal-phosphate dependent TrpB-like enzyme [Ignisphaera aggregans DSM 17230]